MNNAHGPVEGGMTPSKNIDLVTERITIYLGVPDRDDHVSRGSVAGVGEAQHGVRWVDGKAVLSISPQLHEQLRGHVADLALRPISEVQSGR